MFGEPSEMMLGKKLMGPLCYPPVGGRLFLFCDNQVRPSYHPVRVLLFLQPPVSWTLSVLPFLQRPLLLSCDQVSCVESIPPLPELPLTS